MIIRNNTVIAGNIDRLNLEAIEDYVEKTIGVFTEAEWADKTDAEKASYKLALIYEEIHG